MTDRNWRLLAARSYVNFQSTGDEEFEQDLQRLKYVKKALTRYRTTGEIRERAVLNHLIVLCNVFGPVTTCRMVFLKMRDHLAVVKPFLVLLRILPDVVSSVDGRDWRTDEIPMDPRVVEVLRTI